MGHCIDRCICINSWGKLCINKSGMRLVKYFITNSTKNMNRVMQWCAKKNKKKNSDQQVFFVHFQIVMTGKHSKNNSSYFFQLLSFAREMLSSWHQWLCCKSHKCTLNLFLRHSSDRLIFLVLNEPSWCQTIFNICKYEQPLTAFQDSLLIKISIRTRHYDTAMCENEGITHGLLLNMLHRAHLQLHLILSVQRRPQWAQQAGQKKKG